MLRYRCYTYALIIGVCVFLSLRCERTFLPVDSSEKIDYLQGNTKARVIIKLLDRHTFAPLSKAMVTIVGIDSVKSDSTGTAVFDSISIGSYLITCAKSGFESTQGILGRVVLRPAMAKDEWGGQFIEHGVIIQYELRFTSCTKRSNDFSRSKNG